MSSFVGDFLEHTKCYESPTSFWKWSAYFAIAAVLRDNTWLIDGDSRLYPNLYILFLAGSAQRKGRPISLSEHLVNKVNNVKIISGRASIQAILMEISHTETDENGQIKRGGSAVFFAPELAAGIVTDDQSIQILTDIYDFKPTGHTTSLVGRGKTKLDQLVFSMLAGSNEELVKELYNSKAVYGGLLGRTFLVCADEFRPSIPFPASNPTGFDKLVKKLRDIAVSQKGEMEFTREGKDLYSTWYIGFREKSRSKPDRAGVHGRLPTNVKKLSVILAANDLSEVVGKHHVARAIDETLALLPNYSQLTMVSGKNSTSDAAASLIQSLYSAKDHTLTRKSLLEKHWMMGIDHELLDKALITLEGADMIQCSVVGKEPGFRLTGKCLKILEKEGE